MSFRFTAVLFAFLVGVPLQTAIQSQARGHVFGACAVFAPNGTSAAATVYAESVVLQITQSSGKELHLSLPLRNPVNEQLDARVTYFCRAYADQTNKLVAVGIGKDSPNPYQLQVAVANLETGVWIGNWGVGEDSGIREPILSGFLGGTTSLAVTGVAARPTRYGMGLQHGKFLTLTFDSTGKPLAPVPATRIYSSDSDIFPTYADAGHNLLWVFRCVAVSARMDRQPICPITSTTLTGEELPAVEFNPKVLGRKRTDLWFDATSFTAPTRGMVAFVDFGSGPTLWRVNAETQTADRLVLPRPRFPAIILNPAMALPDSRIAVLSPDGQLVAMALVQGALAFPYLLDNYVYRGTDVAVLRVEPLQLLGTIRHELRSDPIAIAVDHRHGAVTVLVYRKNGWERRELNVTEKP